MVLFAVVLASVVIRASSCTGEPQAAEDSIKAGNRLTTMPEIGMALELARLELPRDRQPVLERIARSMTEFMGTDIPGHRRSAAHFLYGEIKYALGEYRAAAEDFKESGKKGGRGISPDITAAAYIMSLEAAGRDSEAAREWVKWEKKYSRSPFRQEVLIARTWNAIRSDNQAGAAKLIEDLRTFAPWMEKDNRFILADATLAYLGDNASRALTLINGCNSDAASVYLSALCYEAEGNMLKSAARYQEVIERFPASALRDHAMLAKANIFLTSSAYRSAAEEFDRTIETASRSEVRAEAELRKAASVFLDGDATRGAELLREVVDRYAGSDIAARAQCLLGEVILSQSLYEEAIVELNKVLTNYFEHSLAASAQYRVGRCLDAIGRKHEATSAYQAVVSGYPMAQEAPAAAYLAGVGLLDQGRPLAATPYFQLVLDRYAINDSTGSVAFAAPEHQELVETSLCLLMYSYHRAGNLGQLSGVPLIMLERMPASDSSWRAYALLIGADALSAQARYADAQAKLEQLIGEFPEHRIGISANRLLAWTYARQGRDDLAIETVERMLARYAAYGDADNLSSAYLNKAHVLFNTKDYKEAAVTYDEFLRRFTGHPKYLLALYQGGLCHFRLNNYGDAIDRWEEIVSIDPSDEIAEKAWVRAGDLYFKAEHYKDARRCYQGLLDNFSNSRVAARGMLRLAQCEYNDGRDMEALRIYSEVVKLYPGTDAAGEGERGIELALYRLGQREDGTEVLAELVERYPASSFAADAQFEIAMRHYKSKSFPAAAEEFRRVVSQFPGYSSVDRAHFLMADSYSESGDLRNARLAYEQFLMYFPESEFRGMVRFRLGTIRFTEGDFMRAAIDFTSVLDSEANEEMLSASMYNLALCRRMLGENGKARILLERYRAEHAADDERAAEVAQQLGDIHDKAGNTVPAVEEFKRALAANPPAELAVELHYRLGLCQELLDKKEEAVTSYKRAITHKEKSNAFRLSAMARCAALYEEKGLYKKAISLYRDIVSNAGDPELVVAAKERVSQLEAFTE